jgi:hypothetical protein
MTEQDKKWDEQQKADTERRAQEMREAWERAAKDAWQKR